MNFPFVVPHIIELDHFNGLARLQIVNARLEWLWAAWPQEDGAPVSLFSPGLPEGEFAIDTGMEPWMIRVIWRSGWFDYCGKRVEVDGTSRPVWRLRRTVSRWSSTRHEQASLLQQSA